MEHEVARASTTAGLPVAPTLSPSLEAAGVGRGSTLVDRRSLLICLLALPIGLAINVVLARCLSGPDRGLYALLTNFSFVFFLITQLGWGDAVIYRVRGHGVPPRRAFASITVFAP